MNLVKSILQPEDRFVFEVHLEELDGTVTVCLYQARAWSGRELVDDSVLVKDSLCQRRTPMST